MRGKEKGGQDFKGKELLCRKKSSFRKGQEKGKRGEIRSKD